MIDNPVDEGTVEFFGQKSTIVAAIEQAEEEEADAALRKLNRAQRRKVFKANGVFKKKGLRP